MGIALKGDRHPGKFWVKSKKTGRFPEKSKPKLRPKRLFWGAVGWLQRVGVIRDYGWQNSKPRCKDQRKHRQLKK